MLSAPAWGEAVTLADLEGAVIESRVLSERVIRDERGERQVRHQLDLKLAIGPGGKFESWRTPTAYSARGVRRGKTRTASGSIEQVAEHKLLGGGHSVWILAGDSLTFLNTFEGSGGRGGFKDTILFTRGPQGLMCTANNAFLREDGKAGIAYISGITGRNIILLSSKQISSTCRVTNKEAATR